MVAVAGLAEIGARFDSRAGYALSVTDALSRQTTYGYDAKGNVIRSCGSPVTGRRG
jgi:YD repeat-containing protein